MRSVGILGVVVAAALATACEPVMGQTSCFVRGTRVRTPGGDRPIEALEVGDEVLSFVETTMEVVIRKVTHLHRAETKSVRTIEVAGRHIVTTDEHPFWEAERRVWTRAADLVRGSVLAVLEAGALVPRSIERVTDEETIVTVYNLTVEGPEHTYFAEDVAVHNKEPACNAGECGGFLVTPDPNLLVVQNEGNAAFSVEETSIGRAAIDARVLSGELAFEIPAGVITNKPSAAEVAPRTNHSVGGPIQIVGLDGLPLPTENAAILTLGGKTALYVGAGILHTRFEEGVLRLVPEDSTKVRVVPIGDAAVCAASTATLGFDPVTPSELGRELRVASQMRAEGCTTVKLAAATAEGREIRFCADEAAWPFAVDDKITIVKPQLVPNANEGIRLVRADGQAFEMLRFTRSGGKPLEVASTRIELREDTSSCVLPTETKPSCRAASLRAVAVDASTNTDLSSPTSIPIPAGLGGTSGKAWVTGATKAPFTVDCDGATTSVVEVVVRTDG